MIHAAVKSPLEFMGTQIKDLFLYCEPVDVLANKQIQSACKAFVIHIFWPFMIKSSPLRTAVV